MRNRWIVPVVFVAILLAGTGYWGYKQNQERKQLQTYLGNQYKESFYNLLERVENCTNFLGKSIVSTGQEQCVTLLTDVWRQALAAQADLNQLPISNVTLIKTSQFLTQVGDYSRYLAKKNIKEYQLSEEERKKLKSLRAQAADLSRALHDLDNGVSRGTITMHEVSKGARKTIDDADDKLLSNNFMTYVEKNAPFPVLIYDGPFSEHIEQEKPKGLTGKTITKSEGREIARKFPDYPGSPNFVIKELDEEVKGKIPAYQYSVQPNNDKKNHTLIDISKKGGHVVFYLNPRDVSTRKIDRVEALRRGEQFLKSRGYMNMVPTYSWIESNMLTVSYAYKQDDVIVYPDLIKLKIAMDNGQVIGFEGLGFIMSHRTREFPKVEVTEQEVRELLGNRFTVQSIRLALIPTPALKEILTWEARVNYEEETYLLYYDVKSSEEVNILRVIDTPEGTFTN